MWPDTYSTMTIDEFHVFFHTQQKACMLYIPSWYTGRAFKPVDQGGQSPDFHFGMLQYPLMDGATHHDELWANGDLGYMVMKTSKHPEIADRHPQVPVAAQVRGAVDGDHPYPQRVEV